MSGSENINKRIARYAEIRTVMGAVQMFLNSPARITTQAATMNLIAKQLAKGNFKNATTMMNRIATRVAATPADPDYPMPAAGEEGKFHWTPGGLLPKE